MADAALNGRVLGIDIGSNSLGWALIEFDGGKPAAIFASGVRVFDAGMDKLEKDGRGVSRALKRRQMRLIRRMTERRTRRLGHLARVLQKTGLLPAGPLETSTERHGFFNVLDKEVGPPYGLRARALDEILSPHEFGRALYHIAQRRGFLSNRKTPQKKDEDIGKVKKGIGELSKKMDETGARTLGEYFAGLDSHEERIRDRYTSRAMYQYEFEMIWEAQRAHHPAMLTDEAKKRIHHAIFHQRPLKSQKHLVGRCELEPDRKRAPWAILAAQRFRYLQRLNDLEINDGKTGEKRQPTDDERSSLIGALNNGDLTFVQARKLLKLPKGSTFNLESGGEKRIPGNRTAEKLASIFGERWDTFTDEEKDAVVEEVRSVVKEKTLKKRGIKAWALDEEKADAFSRVELEDGYCNFSRKAIGNILPHLQQGQRLMSIVRDLYPDRREMAAAPMDFLPPVRSDYLHEIRNPVVERSLTELRKVVNALVKTHGKPELIRIELARELRQPAKQRVNTWKKMRNNQKERDAAAKDILKETGISKPRRDDILKVLLFKECGRRCPYTGKEMSISALVGDNPQFDIEHIIPFHRSLDDSFLNKTLCHADENRSVKGGKTPYEAYHGTEKWGDIIGRVKSFKSDVGDEKLRRFMMAEDEMEEFVGGFTSRQLNDTRYASRLAKQYLGLLYGGINDDGIDADGRRRVQAVVGGQVTAHLRGVWQLNSILGGGDVKTRDDHRHHAIDAIVAALANHGTIKMLSEASKRARLEKRRRFGRVAPPWDGFLDNVRESINAIVVSRRVTNNVRGALHQNTFYGRPAVENGAEYVKVRKPLDALSTADVDDIVDPVVREIVREKAVEHGGDPSKVFKRGENLPSLRQAGGRTISVKRVRLKKKLATFTVGEGHRTRHVQSESNHHMEIVENIKTGKWEGHVVSMYEAHQRLRSGEPVIKRNHGKGKRFVFSLAGGDVIELDNGNNTQGLYVIRTVPISKQFRFVHVNDARRIVDIPKTGQTGYPETLRIRNCQKKVVTPLGEVRDAND